MRVLGIETSTPACGVALADSGRAIAEYTLDAGVHHAERLSLMIRRVLEDTGFALSDLGGVAVAAGPGSFTGLRIGMGTAKGICLACGLPLLAVPTLEGLALRAAFSGLPVCAMLDARRGEVYAGVYHLEGERPIALARDAAVCVGDLLPRLPRPLLFVGAGAYRGQIREALGGDAHFAPDAFSRPAAAAVALLGAFRLKEGRVEDLFEAEPTYLRRAQAERLREAGARPVPVER